jgi:hypothetical protein
MVSASLLRPGSRLGLEPMDGLEFVRQVATVETAKGVNIVILGNAWTVTPIAQTAAL